MKRLLAVVLALALCLGLFVTAASAREAGYGDVDGNGTINASDALQVLRHAVGKTRLNGEQQTLADVDADDAINASDALMILKRAVGKLSIFPVEDSFEGSITLDYDEYTLSPCGLAVDLVRLTCNDSEAYISFRCSSDHVGAAWGEWTERDNTVLPLFIGSQAAVDETVSINVYVVGHEYISKTIQVTLRSDGENRRYGILGEAVPDFGTFARAPVADFAASWSSDDVFTYRFVYEQQHVAHGETTALDVTGAYETFLTDLGYRFVSRQDNASGGRDAAYAKGQTRVVISDRYPAGEAATLQVQIVYDRNTDE